MSLIQTKNACSANTCHFGIVLSSIVLGLPIRCSVSYYYYKSDIARYHKGITSSLFFFHIPISHILSIYYDTRYRMYNLFQNCKVNKKKSSLSSINVPNLIWSWKTYSSVSHIMKTTVLCPMGNICINFFVYTPHFFLPQYLYGLIFFQNVWKSPLNLMSVGHKLEMPFFVFGCRIIMLDYCYRWLRSINWWISIRLTNVFGLPKIRFWSE